MPSYILESCSREYMLRSAYAYVYREPRYRTLRLYQFVAHVTGEDGVEICIELGWDPDMRCGQKLPLPRPKIEMQK